MCTSRPIRLSVYKRGPNASQIHIPFLHSIYSTKACSLFGMLCAKTYYKIVEILRCQKNNYNFE
jgi:hypothetical protein